MPRESDGQGMGGESERQRGGDGGGAREDELAGEGRHSKRELLRLRSGKLPWNQMADVVVASPELPRTSHVPHPLE